MGSPVGPVLANIFMCDFEENLVMNHGARPTIWFRYVDDTFTLFHSKYTSTRTFNSQLNLNRTKRFFLLMFSSNANLTTLFPFPSTERKRSLVSTLNGILSHLGNTKLKLGYLKDSNAAIVTVIFYAVIHLQLYSR